MDWSLALISQGIRSTLLRDQPEGKWVLSISAHDAQKAFQTIRIYHAESRGWPWHDVGEPFRIRFSRISLLWALVVGAVFYWSPAGSGVRNAGIMDSTATLGGQWWRLFTAIWLHADLRHLAANLGAGVILLGLALGRFGAGPGLLAALLAGAGGNVVSLALNSRPYEGLGASGMIMGALGLIAAQSVSDFREKRFGARKAMAGLAAGAMLFALYGLDPQSDIPAHFGGFVTGLVIGAGLLLVPRKRLESRGFKWLSAVLFFALAAGTWALALLTETSVLPGAN